jgi:hypothetical protein
MYSLHVIQFTTLLSTQYKFIDQNIQLTTLKTVGIILLGLVHFESFKPQSLHWLACGCGPVAH